MRPLAAFGVLASLAAASNATITFSGLGTAASVAGSGVVLYKPLVVAPGSNTLVGQFTVQSTTALTDVTVSVGSNYVMGGTLSFSASLDSGIGSVYNQTVVGGGFANLGPGGVQKALTLATYTVSYSLSYNAGLTSFTQASFVFHDSASTPPPAVPEPASMAALGVGAVGLLARRRRTK